MSKNDTEERIPKHDVNIEYCVHCDFSGQALRTIHELIPEQQLHIGNLHLKMGSGGVFEVQVDGSSIFSREELGRHAEEGEILERFREAIAEEVPA